MQPKPPISKHLSQRNALALLLGALVLTYISCLLIEYGYNDDYHFITRANTGRLLPLHNEIYDDGRPVMSFLYSGLYRSIDSVSGLRWIRLSSLLALLGLAVYLFKLLNEQLGTKRALLATLLACATPPVAVLVGWAGGGIHNWLAALMAMAAGDLWLRGWSGRRLLCFPAAGLLLLLSMCTYQPSAAFFFLPMLVRLWSQGFGWSMLGKLAAAAGSFVLGGVAYLALVRYVLVGQSTRVEVAIDFGQKFVTLWTKMLLPSLESWAVFYPAPVAWSVALLLGLLMLTGLFYKTEGRWTTALANLLWTGLFVGATLGPSFIAANSYPVYRSQLGLYFATALLLMFGLFTWATYFRERSPGKARFCSGAGIALVVLYLFLSGYHLLNGIVVPNHREYTHVRDAVHERFDAIPEAMVYTRPPHAYSTDGIHHGIFEYGVVTSPNEHTTEAFLHNMLREKFVLPQKDKEARQAAEASLKAMKIYTQATPDRDLPIIDGFELVVGPPIGEREDPYWGPVKVYPNGWLGTWLGYVDNSGFPHVYHDHFGWIYCDEKTPKGEFVFNVINDGYILTTPEMFPTVYRLDDYHPVLVIFEVAKERWYFDHQTQQYYFVRANYWQVD